jgi:hypothetical protein
MAKARIVLYKQRGSKVWLSFYKITTASTDKGAIAIAKKIFIDDWYEGPAKGKKVMKKMTFQIYKV